MHSPQRHTKNKNLKRHLLCKDGFHGTGQQTVCIVQNVIDIDGIALPAILWELFNVAIGRKLVAELVVVGSVFFFSVPKMPLAVFGSQCFHGIFVWENRIWIWRRLRNNRIEKEFASNRVHPRIVVTTAAIGGCRSGGGTAVPRHHNKEQGQHRKGGRRDHLAAAVHG